jgi:glycosyltransferase involved in cell wall biosynthesis
MQTDGQPLPGVSYVMPVLNEVTEVRAAVASLLDQDYTGVFEVILALGPSIDGTNELVAEMSAADPRIRAIDNPVGSTPAGLNVAITASVHPVVVRVDAHSVLPPDYTRIAVRTLLESGADNVGGIMRAEGRSPFERAVALAYGSRVGLGGTPHHVGGTAGPAETAYLGVFRRDRLFEVGLFDEGIKRGQDWELNRRLRQTGGTVWFTPELVVTYRPRPSLKRLVRQFVATGLWRGELARRFPANNGLRWSPPWPSGSWPASSVSSVRPSAARSPGRCSGSPCPPCTCSSSSSGRSPSRAGPGWRPSSGCSWCCPASTWDGGSVSSSGSSPAPLS